MCVYTHALAPLPSQSCRKNAKWGQDQLDSIDFIGKNSAATFVRVNFNQKTVSLGGGMVRLMADRRLNTWTFPTLESWMEWLIDGFGINDCKALVGPWMSHDGPILEGREVPGCLHLCPVCVESG